MLAKRLLRTFCSDYQELASKMVAESNALAKGLGEEQISKMKASFTPHQAKRIEKIASIMADLNEQELSYVLLNLQKILNVEKNIPLLSLYTDWTSIKANGTSSDNERRWNLPCK